MLSYYFVTHSGVLPTGQSGITSAFIIFMNGCVRCRHINKDVCVSFKVKATNCGLRVHFTDAENRRPERGRHWEPVVAELESAQAGGRWFQLPNTVLCDCSLSGGLCGQGLRGGSRWM